MVAQLRDANIRAELYIGHPKNMGNQSNMPTAQFAVRDHPG